MKKIRLSALFAIGILTAVSQVSAVREAARPPEDYPLVCRGGGSLVIGIAPGERNIGFTFLRGTKPAGEGLAPGECSWIDRGMYAAEPDRVSQHVEDGSESLKVGGTLAPENRWYVELHSSDSYWTFMVSNNGRGQLIATSGRPNPRMDVSPTAATSARPNGETIQSPLRIPIGDPAQKPARTGRGVENPNLAQLELSQIQSIGPRCTSADIASLQIRTTAGATFSSHSSCFPYLCDTATKTCATGCADGKDARQEWIAWVADAYSRGPSARIAIRL